VICLKVILKILSTIPQVQKILKVFLSYYPTKKPLQLLFVKNNGAEAPLVPVMGERRD